jgi:hypothetical protein
MCSDGINACSNSCTCVGLFSCLADAGVSATTLTSASGASLGACVPGGITSAGALLNDPGVQGLYMCLTVTCAGQCAAVLPATDAGTDGGGAGDAGTTADTGTTTDAGDGG